VSLVTFRPLNAALLETSVELTLRLTNGSPEPLALRGSSHRLYLNETYVGRALNGDAVTLPPWGSTTQNVTFFLENLALMGTVQSLGNAALINYRLRSELHAAAPNPVRSFKISATGQLDVRRMIEGLPR
jgi:LEA14-like dessication related protein